MDMPLIGASGQVCLQTALALPRDAWGGWFCTRLGAQMCMFGEGCADTF